MSGVTQSCVRAYLDGLTPDPDLTVSEWADTYRILPSKGSAEPGRYRTSRAPFLREIMDSLSPNDPVQRVVFMKPSQVGGTELGLNFIGSIIHLFPAPVMIVQPTIDLAERFSKQRIQPMIDETPVLREKVQPARSRDSGNSILMKDFPGGVMVISGSNSAVSLRQMPVRFLFCDEISGYEKDVGNEGDPVSLAEKRTQTFARRKIFLNSTPTTKDDCRIEFEYLKSDQRRYFVPCPLCGEHQYLKFRQLKWTDEDPKTAEYECEKCKGRFPEHHKTKMLEAGEWQATAPGDGETRGYHVNALYSPLGWKSWSSIVREFLESKGDAPKLKAFVNSILGETFEEEYAAKVGAEGLKARAELYPPGTAPIGVLVLTAGIDVQDNRLSISVYGFGRGEEQWLVSRIVVYGDPSRPEVWKQADDILFRDYPHESGHRLPIAVACIDTGGHHTQEVYQYVRERKRRAPKTFVIGIKGQSQKGKPAIGKPTKVDINFRGQVMKSGAELYPVGSDTIKSVIYGRFKHNEPGEGYIHFHAGEPDEFFQEITSEKLVTRYVKGFPVREWVKKTSARNEALDEIVYAYAAMQFLYTRYNRASVWDQLEKKYKSSSTPPATEVVASGEVVSDPNRSPLKSPSNRNTMGVNPRRRSFITNY